MSLSIRHLERVHESEKITGAMKEKIGIILEAINDWPSPIISLLDYEKEVSKLIGVEVTGKTIKEYISNIDYSNNAWEGESLSQIIAVFNYYEEGKQLKEILNEIKEEVTAR